MDIPERKLKEKTRSELIAIIKEFQSERDAVKENIFRLQIQNIELTNELNYYKYRTI